MVAPISQFLVPPLGRQWANTCRSKCFASWWCRSITMKQKKWVASSNHQSLDQPRTLVQDQDLCLVGLEMGEGGLGDAREQY